MEISEFHASRRFAPVKSGRIAYFERGEGPPALFVHGVPICGYHWRHIFDRVKHRRRCIAVDLMGLGYTEIAPAQDVSFTAQAQMLAEVGRLPDACIACVGGGSNSIGLFHAFVDDELLTRGAAIAFYAVTALPPILYIFAVIAGAVFGRDAAGIGDVEGKRLGAGRTGGGRGGLGRTGGQHHVVTTVGELAAHLAADPAIASGNQRNGAHVVDCLHMM